MNFILRARNTPAFPNARDIFTEKEFHSKYDAEAHAKAIFIDFHSDDDIEQIMKDMDSEPNPPKKMEPRPELTASEAYILTQFVDLLDAEPGYSSVSFRELSEVAETPMPNLKGIWGSLTKKELVQTTDFDDEVGEILYLTETGYYFHERHSEDENLEYVIPAECVKEPRAAREAITPANSIQSALVGQTAMIYRHPVTMEMPEGNAMIEFVFGSVSVVNAAGDMMAHCSVHFNDNPEDGTFSRSILLDKDGNIKTDDAPAPAPEAPEPPAPAPKAPKATRKRELIPAEVCNNVRADALNKGDYLEKFGTGRAVCRQCGQKIRKGILAIEFGHAFPASPHSPVKVQIHYYECGQTAPIGPDKGPEAPSPAPDNNKGPGPDAAPEGPGTFLIGGLNHWSDSNGNSGQHLNLNLVHGLIFNHIGHLIAIYHKHLKMAYVMGDEGNNAIKTQMPGIKNIRPWVFEWEIGIDNWDNTLWK